MWQPSKIDATTFRCSVNFNATEEATLMAMHKQSGVASLSSFMNMQLFGQDFQGSSY
ncbi:plasmid mobilization protein [Bacteroides acidifaciens]